MPVAHYEACFNSLKVGEADIFLRGAYEILDEKKALGSELEILNSFGVYYPQSSHFFVAKANTALAEVLKKGLSIIRSNEEYQKLLESFYGQISMDLASDKRVIINVSNKMSNNPNKKFSKGRLP